MICFSSSLRMTPTHIHSPMPVNGSGNFYSVPWRTWLRLSDQSMATSALIDINRLPPDKIEAASDGGLKTCATG